MNKKEFVNFIKESINKKSKVKKDERIAVAKKNSWKIRYEQIKNIIIKINEKKKLHKVEWEKSFREYNNIIKK